MSQPKFESGISCIQDRNITLCVKFMLFYDQLLCYNNKCEVMGGKYEWRVLHCC